MIFDSKDDKVNRLKKDVHDMERRVESSLQKMNETIKTLNDIILRLQRENVQLRSERDFLIERHKKMLKRVPVPDLAVEINERLVKPTIDRIKENVDFVQLVAKEGFVEIRPERRKKPREEKDPSVSAKALKEHIEDDPKPSYGKSIDIFFELVSKNGRMRADEAARKRVELIKYSKRDASPTSSPEAFHKFITEKQPMMPKELKNYKHLLVNTSEKNIDDEILVIELKITDDESFNRLTKRRMCTACGDIIPWLPETRDLTNCQNCGGKLEPRKDDHPEIARKRIKEQGNEATKPILDYYDSLGLLKRVDGMKMIEEVEKEIEKKIKD